MQGVLVASYVVFVVLIFAAALFTLVVTTYAWRYPNAQRGMGFAHRRWEPDLTFSLIIPARHEEAVIETTVERLTQLDYPFYEVVLVVGHDDPGMIKAARRCQGRSPHLIKVVVDSKSPKNKPKALNSALPHCEGQIVGVFDAEDLVHPSLLRSVGAEFSASGADVVQGGVQLMDYWTSWYSALNVLEYFFWFRSRLLFQAANHFVPLGGNTVFIKRKLLVEAGGWDEECLAEDCELGVRLSSVGADISVCYEPDLVTREETPGSLRALIRQRTRWNQGFLQVLLKGEWLALPRLGDRIFAALTLALPFFQALVGIFIPLSVVTILFVRVPVGLALISFIPLIPTAGTVALHGVGLAEFGRLYDSKPSWRDFLAVVAGIVPYHVALAYSASAAVVRQALGITTWQKTTHRGTLLGAGTEASTEILVDLRWTSSREEDAPAKTKEEWRLIS